MEKGRTDFIKLSDAFIKDDEITADEKFIYAVIKINNPLGLSTVSIVGILEQLNMSSNESRNKSKIKKAIQKFEELGHIEVYKDQAGMCMIEASKIKPATAYSFKCLDTVDEEGYFTIFDTEVIKKFMGLEKREKFGVFSVYASVVAPIFEDDKNTKVSWVSQETIQLETGLSEKTVSKYIYLLKDNMELIDLKKLRFTPRKHAKGKKVVSKTHNFYWKIEDSSQAVSGVKDAMNKLGYSKETHYIQQIDRNNQVVEVQDGEL